jgi:Cys-tRNA(Pro) deacylase
VTTDRPRHELRRARPDDVRAITALVDAAYGDYVALIGRKPEPMLADHARAVAEHEVWVVDEGGEVLAVAELIDRDEDLWIENVAVAPDHQGRGIGRLLLEHVERTARMRGRPVIRLLTNERMTRNRAMYERLGYRETHREPRGGTEVVHFEKEVAVIAEEGPTPAITALEAAGVPHRVVRTRPARSPEESAELQGIPLAALLRTIVVRRGADDYAFVLVPGGRRFDWPKLRAHLGVNRLSLPDADEARAVTGYERGAITPFGASRSWPVIADASVLEPSSVAIGGGARGVNVHLDPRVLVEHLRAAVADVTVAE